MRGLSPNPGWACFQSCQELWSLQDGKKGSLNQTNRVLILSFFLKMCKNKTSTPSPEISVNTGFAICRRFYRSGKGVGLFPHMQYCHMNMTLFAGATGAGTTTWPWATLSHGTRPPWRDISNIFHQYVPLGNTAKQLGFRQGHFLPLLKKLCHGAKEIARLFEPRLRKK